MDQHKNQSLRNLLQSEKAKYDKAVSSVNEGSAQAIAGIWAEINSRFAKRIRIQAFRNRPVLTEEQIEKALGKRSIAGRHR